MPNYVFCLGGDFRGYTKLSADKNFSSHCNLSSGRNHNMIDNIFHFNFHSPDLNVPVKLYVSPSSNDRSTRIRPAA